MISQRKIIQGFIYVETVVVLSSAAYWIAKKLSKSTTKLVKSI